MPIISADSVSVCYVTGDLKNIGLKEYIVQKIKGDYKVEQFWANKNISFSLDRGDMMAIIGTNGAGKSTLLKAISGVMKPSQGTITVQGKIAALLELASGFDGELTVRENTYLRGAMLGYTRGFMDEQYEEIIRFAELENFQDRPFKQLSSGMKSRLAFAIASLVSPDIIILDEVLSVGDGSFKEKSAAKMREILDSGVTGILVSHSAAQVRQLCNKVLWLDHGNQVGFSDDVEIYCNAYEEFLKSGELPENEQQLQEMGHRKLLRKKAEQEKRRAAEAKRQEELARKREEEARRRQEAQEKKVLEETRRKEEKAKLIGEKQSLNQERVSLLKKQQELQWENNKLNWEIARLENRNLKLKAELEDSEHKLDFSDGAYADFVISKYLQFSRYARIDLKNEGKADNELEFLSISDDHVSLMSPDWFNKDGVGYVLETYCEELQLSLKVHGDGKLNIALRGKDVVIYDKRIPVWIEYTCLDVNGQNIIEDSILACHDKAYRYNLEVKDGDIVDITLCQKHKQF